MIRIVHAVALTVLITSGSFMIASFLAHNSAGLESSADGLATAYLWTFALAVALYALVAVLLIGRGVVRLIARRRVRP